MPSLRTPSSRATAALALGSLALAATFVVQSSGPNQAAHFALVRSLTAGTAVIDPRETIDASYVDGRLHRYTVVASHAGDTGDRKIVATGEITRVVVDSARFLGRL